MKYLIEILIVASLLIPSIGHAENDVLFTGVRFDGGEHIWTMGYSGEIGHDIYTFTYTDLSGEYKNVSSEIGYIVTKGILSIGPVLGPESDWRGGDNINYIVGAVGGIAAVDLWGVGAWGYYKAKYALEDSQYPNEDVWGFGVWVEF